MNTLAIYNLKNMNKYWLFFILLFCLAACSKEEEVSNTGDNAEEELSKEIILSEDYVSIDWNQVSLTKFDEQTGAVELTSISGTLPQLAEGNVFVALSDDYTVCSVRRVKSAQTEGNTLKIDTDEGCMADIFEEANFTLMMGDAEPESDLNVFYPTVTVETDPETDEQIVTRAGVGVEKQLLNIHAELNNSFKFVDDTDPNMSMSITPSSMFDVALSVGMEFNFKNKHEAIDKFANKKLGKFALYAKGTAEASMKLGLEASREVNLIQSKRKLILKNCLQPITKIFWVGSPPVVPVAVHVSADLYGDIDAGLYTSIDTEMGLSGKCEVKASVQYDQASNQVKGTFSAQKGFEWIPPTTLNYNFGGKVRCTFYPRLRLYAYGLVGPHLDVKPFVEADGRYSTSVKAHDKELSKAMQFNVKAGLTPAAEFDFRFLDKLLPSVKLLDEVDFVAFSRTFPAAIVALPKTRADATDGALFMIYDSLTVDKEKSITPCSYPMDLLVYDTNKQEYIIAQSDENGIVHFPYTPTGTEDNVLVATIYNGDGEPISSAEQVVGQAVYIPDAEFRKYLYQAGLAEPYSESNGLVTILPRDREQDISINTWGTGYDATRIQSLEGIEYLLDDTFLLNLRLDGTTGIKNLNLKEMKGFKEIDLINVDMENVDFSQIETLEGVHFMQAHIDNCNLSNNKILRTVNISNDVSINNLDMSSCPILEEIPAGGDIRVIDLSHCISLENFTWGSSNGLSSANLTGCTALKEVFIDNCKAFSTLSLDGCDNLTSINIQGSNNFTSLDCSGMEKMERIEITSCPLSSLNVDGCTSLTELGCIYDADYAGRVPQLSFLDVSSCKSLNRLAIGNNQSSLSVNIGTLPQLYYLEIAYSHLTHIDINNCPNIGEVVLNDNDLTSFTLPDKYLILLNLLNNRITQVIPDNFNRPKYFYCDYRYDYYTDPDTGEQKYTDNGVGWWYSYEPDSPR